MQILINGYEIIHENLGGQQSIAYNQIYVPGSLGIHTLEVIVTNNDNDWDGDQETASEAGEVAIVPDPIPPPLIIGWKI